jgi:hypothetical protein
VFTRIADDYVFKQVRVTHSSVLDFGLLLLLGVSRVKREREKERKREREKERVLCSYINGEKGRILKLFTMKSNSSYSITHLSLSLSLYFATGGGEEAAARRRRASSIGSLFRMS